MQDELGEKIMKEIADLRPKINNYLADDDHIEKKEKYINNNKTILRSQKRFRSEEQNVFTEKVSKIAQSAKNDK